MKKTIIIIFLAIFLISPNTIKAQEVSQETLRIELIKTLVALIASLQQQIAEILAKQQELVAITPSVTPTPEVIVGSQPAPSVPIAPTIKTPEVSIEVACVEGGISFKTDVKNAPAGQIGLTGNKYTGGKVGGSVIWAKSVHPQGYSFIEPNGTYHYTASVLDERRDIISSKEGDIVCE